MVLLVSVSYLLLRGSNLNITLQINIITLTMLKKYFDHHGIMVLKSQGYSKIVYELCTLWFYKKLDFVTNRFLNYNYSLFMYLY